MHLCIQSAAAAAAAALCVAILLLLLQRLLLFIVCRMAETVNSRWFIGSDSIQFFLSLQARLIFNVYVPLGSTVAFTASICVYYILGNYGHLRSQSWRQPAAAKPPL